MVTYADVIRIAKEKVQKGWTRGALFRNRGGTPLNMNTAEMDFIAKNAVRCCAEGALRLAVYETNLSTNPLELVSIFNNYVMTNPVYGVRSLYEFNDSHSKREILTLFDRVIEAQEEEKDAV